MDDKNASSLVRRARNVRGLSSNDVYELKKIYNSGWQPHAGDIRRILDRAHNDDDAVILKQALVGSSSLSSGEKYRLEKAITSGGRRLL